MLYKEKRPAIIMLRDGRYFRGIGFGASKIITGELVFTTITGAGYNETLTDPSYQGQIVIMTHPLVGNYGVPAWEKDNFGVWKYFESDSIKVSGYIVNECCKKPHHYESNKTLDKFLEEEDVPGIEWIDTRALTKILREEGVQVGLLATYDAEEEPDIEKLRRIAADAKDPNLRHLASEVSTKSIITHTPKNPIGRVVVLDMGVKLNILRNFLIRDIETVIVPFDYNYDQIMELKPNGVFISNGPGNPAIYKNAIKLCKNLIKNNIPTMGICLGNQIMGLAAGGESYKLKFGHRGGNKTVINTNTQKCYITTQNHGFCVKDFEAGGFKEFLKNIDDNSNEGIVHESKPMIAVQFHPEAAPGPFDSLYLFDKFKKMMELT
ncbi:MAG: glutamine-hydrolyzing carbamoyl-phosphate synthase small subunit [Candidatus Lokiarchaeota archaeon]|nr:glutamine-hydrolyzing carbamoyl-phosphate synthase small subunit [Candidatus Lokiarchaeota archaeon]MBD3339040.1 glutamine-hydrolyzing carbamoyl-phosphate synthase small subunit [Candidatus Lokiarchaeota archaeon]